MKPAAARWTGVNGVFLLLALAESISSRGGLAMGLETVAAAMALQAPAAVA